MNAKNLTVMGSDELVTKPDLSAFRSQMISVPRDQYNDMFLRYCEQKEAITEVLIFVEQVQKIIEPHQINDSGAFDMAIKLPKIIKDFMKNKDSFLKFLNPEFLNKLKELSNEIPGNQR